ncbi:hypothetical protein ISO73_15720 [Morganella morganii subsp. morganii]|uniref:hypothetical protein n=2 Tax=Morganella morganii TaxID=582 RepID=UPI001BA8FAE6|nr:hypothetical protein [Morganella morganii]ELA8473945.1 hypothetical protein [Morganella morganii]MBT0447868.1 hypothetical protein [Morganella morganii subsp. morganii]MBT0451698.1 hypothetical protein [Morganella morganii subsp. morganii]MBT0509913.1 hypothetical protein [Morganella morganii subsp. morganii]QUI28836.1 hypothetical protein H4431_06900 [Morganella morganii]
MFDWISLSVNSAVGLITGGFAAVITSRIAINKFYKEKWWERKSQSYNTLIDALIEMEAIYKKAVRHYQTIFTNERSGNESELDVKFDWGRYNELSTIIRRIHILAPISLSKKAKELLEEYFIESELSEYSVHEEGYHDFLAYDDLSKTINSIINSIIYDARKELRFN